MSRTLPSRPAEALDAALLRGWPLQDDIADDKQARGTVLVVGGADRTPGAVLLAGIAALRMGAGRLQIVTAAEVAVPLAVAVPEALVVPMHHEIPADLAQLVAAADAVAVGPGLLDPAWTSELLAVVLEHAAATTPVVVDAGALDALADRPVEGRALILTPNRAELDTLLAGEAADDPLTAVARRYDAAVASFDRVAAADGRSWRDPLDVRGLGTSGAGDVLAGAAAAAAARCGDAVQAACWATLVHRTAARRLAGRVAATGYLARELAAELAPALEHLARIDGGRSGSGSGSSAADPAGAP